MGIAEDSDWLKAVPDYLNGRAPRGEYIDPRVQRTFDLIFRALSTFSFAAGVPIGSILYWDGSSWVSLPPGTLGKRLQTNGTGLAPSWEDAGSAPTGPAGGDLSGTYPNPSVATVGGVSAATVISRLPSTLPVPIAQGGTAAIDVPTARTNLGVDAAGTPRPPNGAAGGDLSGTYPNPTVDSVGGVPATVIADAAVATPTLVSSGPYTVLNDDTIIFLTNAGITVNLLAITDLLSKRIIIKDRSGGASANPHTINTDGSETVDGGSGVILNQDYASVTLIGSGTEWSVV